MKNEREENEVLRGPLILLAPASNLVAILSLNGAMARTVPLFPRKRRVGTIQQIVREKLSSKARYRHRGFDHDVLKYG